MNKKRENGEGTLRLRNDGRWEARVVVDYDEKGLPITKNVTSVDKEKCLEKLEKLKAEYGKKVNGKISAEMPFGDWITYWYEEIKKSEIRETTQKNYSNKIYDHIIPRIGDVPLNKLSQGDLQKFYSFLKTDGRVHKSEKYGKGLSNQAIRCCHVLCSGALKKAVEEGLIRVNHAEGCNLPPKKSAEMKVLSRDEMQRLIIQAKYDGFFELFILEFSTGLRRGEILGLQWKDLNMKTGELQIKRRVANVDGEIQVGPLKTKASMRSIILPKEILDILEKYKKTVDSKWMFPSPVKDDSPRHPAAVRNILAKILERAECKHIRFHDLRHTFATVALANGMDVKTLSSTIGHTSSTTTLDVYSHVTDDMRRVAANKIEQGFGRNENAFANFEKRLGEAGKTPVKAKFEPKKPKYRKPGTGCISKLNDNLYEGRYSPKDANGKRISKNIYAHTYEECEEKLAVLIIEMKTQIQKEKDLLNT